MALKTLIGIGLLVFLYAVVAKYNPAMHVYFLWIFLPIMMCMTIYALYVAFYIPNKLGYFIIIGVVAYNVLAYISLIKSFANDHSVPPLNYFFCGILIESMVFMLGLGYRIKLIYQDKIRAQEEIREQLKIQANELKTALRKSEEEKITSLADTYENEISVLKLESLRSQMNPHFIFNALNSIKVYLIENDKEKAVYYLNKFAKLIRKILESSRTDSISLAEELEILTLYMNIENIRFEKKIEFSIDNTSTKNLNFVKLPGLILQPFLENSLWHGLMLKEGEKNINIYIYDCNEDIILNITDNGIGRKKALENFEKKSFKKESLGSLFANERLQLFNKRYNKNYSFSIIDLTEDGLAAGTRVEFAFDGN